MFAIAMVSFLPSFRSDADIFEMPRSSSSVEAKTVEAPVSAATTPTATSRPTSPSSGA